MVEVTLYSRSNCHLCDVALAELDKLSNEFEFIIIKKLIDNDVELENRYGEQVPVILINGKPHDFYKIDPERFRKAMKNI